MVNSPMDLMYSLDTGECDGGTCDVRAHRKADRAITTLPPSIEIVHPRDAPRLSLACDAVICYFSLRGCPSCTAFAPVWSEMCHQSQRESVLKVHVVCTPDTKSEAADFMNDRKKFPCVCVFQRGNGGAIPYDGDYGALDTGRLISLVVAKTYAIMEEFDLETPLARLDMEDEEGSDYEEEEEEGSDYEEEEDASVPSHVPNEDGVHVTHDASPPEISALCNDAHAQNRVCVLYYTTWCGHCNALKPTWNEAVTRDDSSSWCAVNCDTDEGKRLADAEGVRGFPTIHLHHDFREAFKGQRSVEGLIDFVSRNTIRPALLMRR